MSNIGKKIKNAGNNIIKNSNISSKNQSNHKTINNNNIIINNQKKKKATTPSINQRERNILLIQGPNAMPGNGLWSN